MANQITTDVGELLVGVTSALKNYTDAKGSALSQTVTLEVQALNQNIKSEVQTLTQIIASQVTSLNQSIGAVQSNVAANMHEIQYALTGDGALVDIVTDMTAQLQVGRNTIKFAVSSADEFEILGLNGAAYTVGHLDQISFTYSNGQITDVVFLDDRTKEMVAASVGNAVDSLELQIGNMQQQQSMDKAYIKGALSQITGLTYNW